VIVRIWALAKEGLLLRQQAFKRGPSESLIAVDIGDALFHQLGSPQEAEKSTKSVG